MISLLLAIRTLLFDMPETPNSGSLADTGQS
jgi:hypothetical protein